MKKLLILFTILLIGLNSFSQSKEFNKVKYVDLKYSGTFNGPEGVIGYYFFYQYEKASKGKYTYIMNLVDINFKTIKDINLVRSKNDILLESTFNGSNFFFTFLDRKKKSIEILSYTKEGKRVGTKAYPKVSTMEAQIMINRATSNQTTKNVIPAGNNGVIRFKSNFDRKEKYAIEAFDNSLKATWKYTSDSKEKSYEMPNCEYSSENIVLLNVSRQKSMLNQDLTQHIILLNAKDGKKVFEIPLNTKKNTKILLNSFVDEEKKEIVLIGEYFNAKDNPAKDKSLGLFTTKIDFAGNTISNKELSWIKDFKKFVKLSAKGTNEEGAYTYIHNIVKTQQGKYFIIGEQYKKAVSALGVAAVVVSGGKSGGALNFVIKDMVLLELDSTFEIQQYKTYEKKERSVNLEGGYSYLSITLLAKMMDSYGYFGYMFTNVDVKRDRFFSSFISSEKNKTTKKNEGYIGTITYENELAFDKLSLATKATYVNVMPAKTGYVTIMEYYKKEKKLKVRTEKINS